jgi:hypothetical protein
MGMWVWYEQLSPEISLFTRPTIASSLLNFTGGSGLGASLGVSALYVQAQGHLASTAGRASVADVVRRAATQTPPLTVVLCFGWSKAYKDATGWASVAEAAPAALNFSLAAASLAKELTAAGNPAPVGVHLDVEPDPSDEAQYQQLADLLGSIRAKLPAVTDADSVSPFEFTSTSSWAFAGKQVSCPTGALASPAGEQTAATFASTITAAAATTTATATTTPPSTMSLLECCAAVLDTTVLMNYRNVAVSGGDGMLGKALPSLEAALRRGSRVALAVETNALKGDKYAYKETLYGTNTSYMFAQMAAVRAALASKGLVAALSNRSAFVVEDWHGLQLLASGGDGPPPPAPPHPTPGGNMSVVIRNEVSDGAQLVVMAVQNKKTAQKLCSLSVRIRTGSFSHRTCITCSDLYKYRVTNTLLNYDMGDIY